MSVKMVLPKQNSPITAIRKKCIDCCGGEKKEIRNCEIYGCPLFPYRFGMMPDTYVKSNEDVVIVDTKGAVKHGSKNRKSAKDTEDGSLFAEEL